MLDLLGRRWMPRIIWELAPGAQSFGELRRRCDSMSTSVLSQRLRDLTEAEMAQTDDFGAWELTQSGQEIAAKLDTLADPYGASSEKAADGSAVDQRGSRRLRGAGN